MLNGKGETRPLAARNDGKESASQTQRGCAEISGNPFAIASRRRSRLFARPKAAFRLSHSAFRIPHSAFILTPPSAPS